MENTERQKFEENWREAFDGAGVRPSENLWNGIEQRLNNAESGEMRKRVVFYQRLAAACILFSLLAGAYGLYWRNEHHDQLAKINTTSGKDETKSADESQPKQVAPVKQDSKASTASETISSGSTQNNTAAVKEQRAVGNRKIKEELSGGKSNTLATKPPSGTDPASNTSLAFGLEKEHSDKQPDNSSSQLAKKETYAYVSDVTESAPLISIDLKGGPQYVEVVRTLPAMPSVFMEQSKSKKYEEKWWAAAGASAGSYNPNFNATSSLMSAGSLQSSLTTASSTPANYGTSYSVALTAAHRVSRRWVLQSGMQYMARSVDYTSNYVSYAGAKSAASLADYATVSSNTLAVTSPYQLESKSEYISIPLQAGYLLIDRKFGLLINSGVSSDIFIRNTLTDLSGLRASYSESAGQNSPYRSFMWSALMSTEFSYKIGTHYRLALVPGMRYSLNQVLKSDQSTQGNPMIWDVGFRFRYIFK